MNRILIIILILAFAGGASAQTPAKKPAAAPAKKAAVKTQPAKAAPVQVSTAAAAPKPDPAAAVLEKLKAWDAKLETLKADFTQEVNFKEAGLKQSIEGSLLYVKPNLLRIEHKKPARQVVVTDKNDIWIYKADDNQAVRTTWDAWRRTQDQNFSGILDFGNYASLSEKNIATVEGEKDGLIALTLTPRSGSGYILKLRLSAADYFPAEAELNVDGTVITTRLTSTEKNTAIDKGIFTFAPPKGVEVLELKN
ncbi:MAG TPA: hypothetical protein DCZ92_14190 [Elusimicrobia bacterium]|nr:MAG: hypothetical protein A2016_03410 [Elusimicrobia bacterium GWF2_62_30]HBA61932.1 hypothetical protein [Elusimicrobiota bacterium]